MTTYARTAFRFPLTIILPQSQSINRNTILTHTPITPDPHHRHVKTPSTDSTSPAPLHTKSTSPPPPSSASPPTPSSHPRPHPPPHLPHLHLNPLKPNSSPVRLENPKFCWAVRGGAESGAPRGRGWMRVVETPRLLGGRRRGSVVEDQRGGKGEEEG